MNEVHLDFNTNHLEILPGSPDKLQLKLQPYSTANGHAGTDVIPVYNDSTGTGIKIDNNYFAWATGDDADGRLTVTGTQPINGPSMDLNSSGFVYNLVGFEDKVGIGTGSPAELLQVEGASGLDGATPPTIQIHSSSAGTWTNNATFARLAFGNDDTDAGMACSINAYVNSTTGNNAGLDFYTSNSANTPAGPRMRISSIGNVGIGTALPTALLEVGGGSGDYRVK